MQVRNLSWEWSTENLKARAVELSSQGCCGHGHAKSQYHDDFSERRSRQAGVGRSSRERMFCSLNLSEDIRVALVHWELTVQQDLHSLRPSAQTSQVPHSGIHNQKRRRTSSQLSPTQGCAQRAGAAISWLLDEPSGRAWPCCPDHLASKAQAPVAA